jgi:uncharacterized protein YggE
VIVTTGEGVVKQAPDRAWVTIAAESRAKTAADAQRMNTDAMTAVLEMIKASGIPAEAIQTSGYSLQPEFDYANGKQTLRGYVARNSVQVRSRHAGEDRRQSSARRSAAARPTSAACASTQGSRAARARGAAAGGARCAPPRRRGRLGAGVHIDRVMRSKSSATCGHPRPMPMMARAARRRRRGPVEAARSKIALRASR